MITSRIRSAVAAAIVACSACGAGEMSLPAGGARGKADEGAGGAAASYANPVVPFDCPDPGILAAGGSEPRYYMVCTGGRFTIRRSADLVTWETTDAAILPEGKASWSANGRRNWAPELHRVGPRTVAYFTAASAEDRLAIGVASADDPLGPYEVAAAPLVEDPRGVIDATYFRDGDGRHYLFYKIDGNAQGGATPIYARELAADGLAFKAGSRAVEVLSNDPASWEGGVVEAPWVVKRGGRYYIFYSGNVYDQRYRTGVARAESVLGPYAKRGAPLLANDADWVGPGHGSVVTVGQQDYFFYHAWHATAAGAADRERGRNGLLDRIVWRDGWPQINDGTPSSDPQPVPRAAAAAGAAAAGAGAQRVLELIAAHDVLGNGDAAGNRALLREPLTTLSLVESGELMATLRAQDRVAALVAALIDIRPSAVSPEALRRAWVAMLQAGKVDHALEILTYASFHSDQGSYCAGTEVHISDYAVDSAVLLHEAHHAFNHVHGLDGINGLNEGTSITVAKRNAGGWQNLAETVFGTVLYYRDIGLAGYPRDIPLGDAGAFDAKGRDYLRMLMAGDESRIDWLDAREVREVFRLFWEPLDRAVPWAQWETAARVATDRGLEWIARHR